MKSQSFFRQLGWVFVATTANGVFNAAIHLFAPLLGTDQYGLFQAILQTLLPELAIPALGLQFAFVHLSASAVSREEERDLSAAIRRVASVLVALWAVIAIVVGLFGRSLIDHYDLGSFSTIAVLLATVLGALLLPVFSGVVQGRQDFFWFGWITLSSGLGRFAGVGLMIGLFGATALNAMLGVLFGQLVSLGVAIWRSQSIWTLPPGKFAAGGFIRRITPLTLALGAIVVLQTADIAEARAAFAGGLSGIYAAAGSTARMVLYLAAPMINVMFPRIVREAAQSTKSTVLAQACGVSLLVCGGAALGATLFPKLPFHIVHGPDYFPASRYLPGMAWCLLPLMLTLVLINNLMARSRYRIVWLLVPLAVGYWFALRVFNETPGQLIATLGCAASAAFVLTIAFTWAESRRA